MGPLGVPEMLFILVLVLLIFGPKRLPEVGRMVGKGLGEFRRASNELKRSLETELEIEELGNAPRPKPLRSVASLPAAGAAAGEVPVATVVHEPAPLQGEARPLVDPLEAFGPAEEDEVEPPAERAPIAPE